MACLHVVAGYRTVPVELGRNYLSEDASQQLMPLNDFLDEFFVHPHDINGHVARIAYLAQHELLDQITDLKRDISIPDYCSLLLDDDTTSSDVIVNAWIGPVGTVSPLHHDPYHNLLAQISGTPSVMVIDETIHSRHVCVCATDVGSTRSGYKYVRLYNPCESHRLYPREGIMRNNR